MRLILLAVYLKTVLCNLPINDHNTLMLRDTVSLYYFHNDVYLLIINIIELQKYNALWICHYAKGKNTCQMPVIFVDYILLTSGKKESGRQRLFFSLLSVFSNGKLI